MTNNLHKYPAYKPSGVEWLGEIPEHWEVRKLKVITSFINRGVTPNYVESSNYKVINQATFSKGYFDLQNIKFTKEKDFSGLNSYKGIVEKNDILLASTGGGVLGKVAFVDFDDNTFQADSHVTIIRGAEPEFASKYYYYILSISYDLINGILAQGSTNQTELQRDWLRDFKLPVPSFKEQTAIANFLDRKTALIDQAIAQKERLIELLKERKQIIIQNAVTKGLDPNVKMKDSGVEWIGEIPEHWKVKRFRYVFNLGKGLTITKENLQDNGIACVNYGEIHSKYGFEVNPEIHELKCVDKEYLKSSPNALLKHGDFVFADTSEDIEGSGNFTYLNSSQKTFAGYHTVIARPKLFVNSRFLAYSFDSLSFRNQIRNKVKGVKVYSITQSILSEPFVWLPTLKEQKEIVEFLDKKCVSYDQSINLNVKQIDKLKEYKSTLIDSAVTGKIKVS